MKARPTAPFAVLALVVAACSTAATPAPTTTLPSAQASSPTAVSRTVAPASLTVFAAASLKAALEKVKMTYEAANPGTMLTISTDSSAALETKIEQGAPADVFLSADTTNPQKLVDNGYAVGGVTRFANNLLTIIVPIPNPAGIQTPMDLAKAGVKVITAGDTVPIARYSGQLVANLASQTGYPSDFVARYTANIVSKEANVSAIVSKIELGEGDAGIVYATDAKTSPKIATLAVPDAANVPATYGGAVVKASRNGGAAGAFLAWLAGPAGQGVLATFGFLPPA